MNSNELRKKFLDFFEQRGHKIFPGISLVPADHSILFTTAGMVQFKNNFLGKSMDSCSRTASSQRCFRTSDVDSVGRTARHLTFFEMLGNFSFGDYFKKEAIQWGWEFLTKEAGLPESKLYASVYKDDEEAFELWKKILPEKRIVKLGKADNFWEMGETGPCGPCSEIYMDMGKELGCGKKNCSPGCECDRWNEVWNLVFTQYDKDIKGNLLPLPQKNIDTGMGLERLTAVVNGLKSNFDTDLLKPIIDFMRHKTGIAYGTNKKKDVAFRIIADHSRAIAFLIADGVIPSNEGRGYVLRRIIRRAVRQASLLEAEIPFIYNLTEKVIQIMKEPYPELEKYRSHIVTVTKSEEEHFKQTLDSGIRRLNEMMASKKNKVIPGKDVFMLYDTYGFPAELTKEMAYEKKFTIDEKEFEKEMQKQRKRAKASWKGSGEADTELYGKILRESGATLFEGYDSVESDSKVLFLIKKKTAKDKTISSSLTDSAEKGEEIEIVLDRTPFYGESGGQSGDKGKIISSTGLEIIISDTASPVEGLIVHAGKIVNGKINKADKVKALIDCKNRNNIKRNHTATHLLQAVLRRTLGLHVQQSGSLVAPDRLRFDFTHSKPLTIDEIEKIQELVNDTILSNIPVCSSETTLSKARNMGAMALFGEKYSEMVRAVKIANKAEEDHFSLELCGGTHCEQTGEIGLFKIISESGVAAGIRRIEALTGRGAYELVIKEYGRIINNTSDLLKAQVHEIPDKLGILIRNNKEMSKKLQDMENTSIKSGAEGLLDDVRIIDGVKVVARVIDGANMKSLRLFGDSIRDKIKSGIIVLGTVSNDKPALLGMVTQDLVKKGYNAGRIVKKLAALIEGSGGGRPDLAQAGGRNAKKLAAAISEAEKVIVQEKKK